jgi:nucleotide sugar dehydrogenase
MKIAVVGSEGYVGKAFSNMLEKQGVEVVKIDPLLGDKSADYKDTKDCKLGIVAVPTQMNYDESFPHPADTTIVEDVVSKLETDIIMIKSTVPPGTTDRLKKETGKRITMSPEYVGEGRYYMPPHLDFSKEMEKTPFWIVGGDSKDVEEIYHILVPILGPLKRYIRVTALEAELIKYWENIYLTMKVILANEMKRSCEALGANYYEVREGWVADPRVDFFHSIAFDGKPGVSGKCLPKDTNAFLALMESKGLEMPMLRGMLKSNYIMRKELNLETQYEYGDR